MTAQNLIGLGIHHELHQRALLALGQRQFHRAEAGFKDDYLVPCLPCHLFGQTTCSIGDVGHSMNSPPRDAVLLMGGYHLPRGEIMNSPRNQQR